MRSSGAVNALSKARIHAYGAISTAILAGPPEKRLRSHAFLGPTGAVKALSKAVTCPCPMLRSIPIVAILAGPSEERLHARVAMRSS